MSTSFIAQIREANMTGIVRREQCVAVMQQRLEAVQ